MAEFNLYTICMQAINDLLEAKFWKSSARNPFSYLPYRLVQDLEVFVRSKRGFTDDKKTYENLQILFESGHITKFDVFHWNSNRIQKLLPDILTQNFCKNLISLSLPKHVYAICPVESILSFCSELEEVHLPVFVDLDVFENCPKLRILKFHASDAEISEYFHKKRGDLPATIRKLKVFSVCNTQSHYAITKEIIAKLLLNCPKLVSVGCCNSLEAFRCIRETQDDLLNPFQLRRCYWGLKYSDFIPTSVTPEFESYQEQFSSMVKMASSMCSFLEELVIDVYDNSCVQHLVKLKNLTLLSISYEDPYDENYQPAFVSLLTEIGPQLKYLSVSVQSLVPVDIICRRCPNLIALRVLGKIALSDDEKKWKDVLDLKSLCVEEIENENLQILFRNCPNMKELFIGRAFDFSDHFLEALLKKGAFPELEVVSVEACSLSRRGLAEFLTGVPTLKKVSFDKLAGIREKTEEIIKRWMKQSGRHIEVDQRLYKKEHFRLRTHPCVF